MNILTLRSLMFRVSAIWPVFHCLRCFNSQQVRSTCSMSRSANSPWMFCMRSALT